MTSHALNTAISCDPTPRRGVPSLLKRIDAAFCIWRQRRQLRHLTPHLREDMGLTEADIQSELQRPLWNAPAHWLK